MDFIPFNSFADLGWALPVVVVSIILFVIALTTHLNWFGKVALVLAIIGMAGSLIVSLGVGVINGVRVEAWQQDVIAEAEDAYGLTLTLDEVRALEWPSEKPKGDYQSYGTIERTLPEGDSFTRRELTLIWSDDELIFAESVSGDEFTELKSR